MNGGGRIRRGWRLSRKSWEIVEHDRSLLTFPALSLLATIVAAILIFGPFAVWAEQSGSHWPFVIGGAVAAFAFNLIATYCGVAFVAVASKRCCR